MLKLGGKSTGAANKGSMLEGQPGNKMIPDTFSVSDDGGASAPTTLFKKPMGFVKKTRTHVGNSAMVGSGVGITGTAFSNTNASPITTKKSKKQKSVSSTTGPSSMPTTSHGHGRG